MYILEHELINVHQNVAHFFPTHSNGQSEQLFDKILQKIKKQ